MGASALQHALLSCYARQAPTGKRGVSMERERFIRTLSDKPQSLHAKALAVEATLRTLGIAAAAAAAALADSQLAAELDEEDGKPAAAAAAAASKDGNVDMYLEMLAIMRAAGIADTAILPSGKVWAVLEAAKWCVANGEKLLIFSQSTATLNDIENELVQHLRWQKGVSWLRIDGVTDGTVRQRLIQDFNKGVVGAAPHAFLLSTRAGGVGINLRRDAADSVRLRVEPSALRSGGAPLLPLRAEEAHVRVPAGAGRVAGGPRVCGGGAQGGAGTARG